MNSPYEPPVEPAVSDLPPIDAGRALRRALAAFRTNFGSLMLVGVTSLCLYMVSVCTCVGWIYAAPVLLWGITTWALDAVGGRAQVDALVRDVSKDPLGPFWKTWVLLVAVQFLMLPGVAPGVALGLSIESLQPSDLELVGWTLAMHGWFAVVLAVMARLNLAFLYLVDGRAGPIEAITRSWRESRNSWGALATLSLLWAASSTPATVVSQVAGRRMSLAAEAMDWGQAAALYGAMLGCSLLNGVLWVLYLLACAAAYRQVVPSRQALASKRPPGRVGAKDGTGR
jgi:hypothetical protein